MHALLPLHLDRLSALTGVPGGFAHHGDSGGRATNCIELHQPLHARHRHRRFVINRTRRAAEHRAQPNRSKQQVGRAHIHAKLRRAIDLGGDIQSLCGLPKQLPALAVFQGDFTRRHTGCRFCKLTVMC